MTKEEFLEGREEYWKQTHARELLRAEVAEARAKELEARLQNLAVIFGIIRKYSTEPYILTRIDGALGIISAAYPSRD